jgi:hypothetical protein
MKNQNYNEPGDMDKFLLAFIGIGLFAAVIGIASQVMA